MDELTFGKQDEEFQAAVDRVLAAERSALRQPARAEVEAALWKWVWRSVDMLLEDAPYFTHGPYSGFTTTWDEVRPESEEAEGWEEAA
jgi:hypothetical protein